MNPVYSSDNPVDAHLLRGLLEAEGIAATVTGDDMAMAPSVVWVDDSADLERLATVIAAFVNPRQERLEAPQAHPCPGCGELIEPPFALCWRCGDA